MRKKDIVHILYNSASFQSASVLSKQLKVSDRTIRNEIKDISKDSLKHGFEIELRRGKGYYLVIHDEKKLIKYLDKESMFDPLNRIDTEIVILLLESEYISQDVIADMFTVTKPVVRSDMDKVESILEAHQLHLDKKSHYGIKVTGTSYNKKCLLVKMFEAKNEYMIRRLETLNEGSLQRLGKTFLKHLDEHGLTANYWDFVVLDSFLKITLLNIDGDKPTVEKHKYEEFSSILLSDIDNIFERISLENDAIDFARFMESRVKTIDARETYELELQDKMTDWLAKIDVQYNLKSSKDDEFKKSILAHTSLLIARLSNSISYNNPLAKDISAKYPVAFNAAIRLKEEIEEEYKVEISQDEIGFIATHFAAHVEKQAMSQLSEARRIAILCSTGGGSAYLIKLKLESIFRTSEIKTFSFTQISEARSFHPDIVFSIKELDEEFNVPVVRINEFLEEKDMLRIKDMFSSDYRWITKDNLLFLFSEDLFYIFEEEIKYEDMLETMIDDVIDKGYAKDDYRQFVLKREEIMSTIFDKGVAIPHPMESACIKESLSIGISKNTEAQVQLIFLVNLNSDSVKTHQEISKMVFGVIESDTKLKDIKDSSTFEEVYSLIKTYQSRR